MSVFALVSLFFIFMALIEYATILMAARLKESFNFNIKWNCETVDFVSMVLYLLGIIVFLISYTSLYVWIRNFVKHLNRKNKGLVINIQTFLTLFWLKEFIGDLKLVVLSFLDFLIRHKTAQYHFCHVFLSKIKVNNFEKVSFVHTWNHLKCERKYACKL